MSSAVLSVAVVRTAAQMTSSSSVAPCSAPCANCGLAALQYLQPGVQNITTIFESCLRNFFRPFFPWMCLTTPPSKKDASSMQAPHAFGQFLTIHSWLFSHSPSSAKKPQSSLVSSHAGGGAFPAASAAVRLRSSYSACLIASFVPSVSSCSVAVLTGVVKHIQGKKGLKKFLKQ
eukprot:COSAG06_NODE_16386_length_1004_cov_0.902762_1_plen_174_part_10